jgi:hypothetical protein
MSIVWVERATGNVKADGTFSGPADFAELSGPRRCRLHPRDVLVSTWAKARRALRRNLAGVHSAGPGFPGTDRCADTAAPSPARRRVALLGIVPAKDGERCHRPAIADDILDAGARDEGEAVSLARGSIRPARS